MFKKAELAGRGFKTFRCPSDNGPIAGAAPSEPLAREIYVMKGHFVDSVARIERIV